ncbi:ABC transporter substrate-binding protein [Paenibacillus sp. HWE-109]|uniref:ABC transporter substrate-binding protein n=1 Tax=Paenibacillus sp. HWE-109 TaxID=1306526 RepID=UPI001EE0014E|nr:ABC transporter substrate-binding protein [Paenibacillus sp. HWE-109]UKS28436.1 ABC transporter substrate-binding protein [Paenibacillus sp. HWE-109]
MAEISKGHRHRIRWMVILLIIVVSLAGCGDKQSKSMNAGANKQTDSGTRKVKDAFGEVEIPIKPKRVAGIYLEDYMLALGVKPIVQWYHPSWGKQDYLGMATTDVPLFDITGSLEPLIEQNLDLIILNAGIDQAGYELYSKIAPTYRLTREVTVDAAATLRTIGDLLGIPEKVDSVLKDYDLKKADAKLKLEAAIGRQTVAVVRLDVGGKPELRLFGQNNAYTGMIYKDLGLEPFPWVKSIEAHEVISQEKIPEFTADHIIIFPSDGKWDSEANKKAVALLDDPIWRSIPAVKNGHVYQLERSHWQSGAITANRMKIDDLLKFLVK